MRIQAGRVTEIFGQPRMSSHGHKRKRGQRNMLVPEPKEVAKLDIIAKAHRPSKGNKKIKKAAKEPAKKVADPNKVHRMLLDLLS